MEKMLDGNLNEIETIYGDVTNALEGLVGSTHETEKIVR